MNVKNRKYYRMENRVKFYNQKMIEQAGCCALCGIKTRLVIDHDHKTGLMRGLLCYKHNTALGFFNENITLMENAITYLKYFGAKFEEKYISTYTAELQRGSGIAAQVEELLDDISFTSDRARARVLAQQHNLNANTAQTKIHRARKRREFLSLCEEYKVITDTPAGIT